jgi:endonuclease/exonuclease/phosphatase family metal-dependent hydrolase
MRNNWVYLAFLCLIVSACYSPFSRNEHCIKKPANDLRIATYNMNWGGNSFSATAPKKTLEVLKHSNADIVLLQEVTPFWFNALKSNLSTMYPYMDFRNDAHAGGMAYISKYPINKAQYLRPPIPEEWHIGIILDVDSPMGAIQVLNLHLTPPLISKENPNFSIGPYFSTCQIREKEIDYFFTHIDKDKPTIIAGDLNEGDNSFVSYYLKQRGFLDAPTPDEYSWQWDVGGFIAKRKLDHVFYNPFFKLDHQQIIHSGDSDHFPIVVDLQENKITAL